MLYQTLCSSDGVALVAFRSRVWRSKCEHTIRQCSSSHLILVRVHKMPIYAVLHQWIYGKCFGSLKYKMAIHVLGLGWKYDHYLHHLHIPQVLKYAQTASFVGPGVLTFHVQWCGPTLHLTCIMLFLLRPLFLFTLYHSFVSGQSQDQASAVKGFFQNDGTQGHTNNWAVLVCSSRYWFNYRVCTSTILSIDMTI